MFDDEKIVLSDRMKELLKEANELKKLYRKKDEVTGFELKIYPMISSSIEFGHINEEIAEFLINAAKENIDVEQMGCCMGIESCDATIDDYKLIYEVCKKLMEEKGLDKISWDERDMFLKVVEPRLGEFKDYDEKKERHERRGIAVQGMADLTDTLESILDSKTINTSDRFDRRLNGSIERHIGPLGPLGIVRRRPELTPRRSLDSLLIEIDKPMSSKNYFVSEARKKGVDIFALARAVKITTEDATIDDYKLIYEVAKELMKKHGLEEIGSEQVDLFMEAIASRLSEIKDYETKKASYEALEKQIIETKKQICDMELGIVARAKGKEILDEVEKLLEAIERGDVDKEEAGNIGKMLEEAKSLMAGNPTEEMRSWDRKKRFEEVMKTMRNNGQNRDDRDEKN